MINNIIRDNVVSVVNNSTGKDTVPNNPTQNVFYEGGDLYLDPSDGLWKYPDSVGDQLRDVQLGALLNLDGIDRRLDYGISGISVESIKKIVIKAQTIDDKFALFSTLNNSTSWIGATDGVGDWFNGPLVGSPSFSIPASTFKDGEINTLTIDNISLNSLNWTGIATGLHAGFEFSVNVFRVEFYDSLDNCIECHNFEGAPSGSTSSTAYDSSGIGLVPNANHGTITGTIDGNTRQSSIEVPSDQNLIGYTDNVTSFPPLLNTPENRALPFAQQKDVLGGFVDKFGRSKYPVTSSGQNIITFDGSQTIDFSDLTGIEIVSWVGTTTLVKVGNILTTTAGTLSYLEFDNGSFYNVAEGWGAFLFDKNKPNSLDATISGDDSAIWTPIDTREPTNSKEGFDLWTLDIDPTKKLYVQSASNGTPRKTNGDTIVGYTWVSRHIGSKDSPNGSESELRQPPAPELYDIEQKHTDDLWFGGGEDPVNFKDSEIETNRQNLNRVFANKSDPVLTTDMTSYPEEQTGNDLYYINKFTDNEN